MIPASIPLQGHYRLVIIGATLEEIGNQANFIGGGRLRPSLGSRQFFCRDTRAEIVNIAIKCAGAAKKGEIHESGRSIVQCFREHTMLRTSVILIPDSMKILAIAAVGLCLIVGAISVRKAMRWLGCILLAVIAAPFYGLILKMLPSWLVVVLVGVAVWRTLRLIAVALLGREAASHMMGILAADVVRGVFRGGLLLATLPFRMLRSARRDRLSSSE